MNSVGKTHPGMIRKNNQDNFLNYRKDDFVVLAVADGLGGHNAGEVASKRCVDLLLQFLKEKNKKEIFTSENIFELIAQMNQDIFSASQSNKNLSGMGTTLSLCVADNSRAMIYQLGDSRVYSLNGKGIHQVTKDHSLVQYMLDSGQITASQAVNHPQKNVITRALGTDESAEADLYEITLKDKDKLLLCSDGLSNTVSNEEIYRTVCENDQETAAQKLIDLANAHGGSDNITVVLFEV